MSLGLAALALLAMSALGSSDASSSTRAPKRPPLPDDDEDELEDEPWEATDLVELEEDEGGPAVDDPTELTRAEIEAEKARIVRESREIIDGKRDSYSDGPAKVAKKPAAKKPKVAPAAVATAKKPAKKPAAKKPPSSDAARAAADAAVDLAAREPAPAKPVTMPPPRPTARPVTTTAAPPPPELVSTVPVLGSQQALNRLGATLKEDGLYGPKTQTAWAAASKRYRPPAALQDATREPVFGRVSATQAAVYKPTAEAIAQAAQQAPPPAASSVSQTSPKPIPEGYDPVKARAAARAVANHLKRSGRANYDRRLLAQWQRTAGIVADGIYGGGTRGALLHYGGTEAPPPFFAPTTTTRYVAPEQR